jgi:hypothetical protein
MLLHRFNIGNIMGINNGQSAGIDSRFVNKVNDRQCANEQ